MNALQKIHASLAPGGLLLDLQPLLSDAAVVSRGRLIGRLDESEFRAYAEAVAEARDETVHRGLFARERQLVCDAVHRFGSAAELLAEVSTWTGTAVPADLPDLLDEAAPPLDVREGARLVLLRAL